MRCDASSHLPVGVTMLVTFFFFTSFVTLPYGLTSWHTYALPHTQYGRATTEMLLLQFVIQFNLLAPILEGYKSVSSNIRVLYITKRLMSEENILLHSCICSTDLLTNVSDATCDNALNDSLLEPIFVSCWLPCLSRLESCLCALPPVVLCLNRQWSGYRT